MLRTAAVSIVVKKGVGITKLIILFVPTKGPDSINRRIRKCKTLAGSKSYYQFIDIGRPGVIAIRERSCHQCSGCMSLTDFDSCVNMAIVGPVVSQPLSLEAEATARVTRSWLQNEGRRLSSGAAVGSLVVVELTNESETFMIGVVTKPKHTIVEAREVLEMGRLKPGDEVLEVHKFEPTQADSNRYLLTDNPAKVFPVFVEDVRDVLRPEDFVDQGGPRRSTRNAAPISADVHGYVPGHAYRLMPGALQHILQLVPVDA